MYKTSWFKSLQSRLGVDRYLAKHALAYDSPPDNGTEAYPIGDGSATALVWHGERSTEIHLNHTDAIDPGDVSAPRGTELNSSVGTELENEPGFRAWSWEGEEHTPAPVSPGRIRIEDGLPSFDRNFLQVYKGRLDIGRAELSVESRTPFSGFAMNARAAADPKVMVFECDMSSEDPVERSITLERWGTRSYFHFYEQIVDDPLPRLDQCRAGETGGCVFVEQRYGTTQRSGRVVTVIKVLASGQRAEIRHRHGARVVLPAARAQRFTVLVAVATELAEYSSSEYSSSVPNESAAVSSVPKADAAADDPLLADCLSRVLAAGADLEGLTKKHTARWADYWNRSLIHIADDYVENIYYVHFYSLGCCGTGRFPALFTGGGWTWNGDTRNWGHFYQWNQQQTYWGIEAAGRPELGENALRLRWEQLGRAQRDAERLFGSSSVPNDANGRPAWFSDIADLFGRQAAEPDTVRNLSTGAQIVLQFYERARYSGDDEFMRDRVLPLARSCLALYRALLPDAGNETPMRISGGSTAYESYLNLAESLTDHAAIRLLYKITGEALPQKFPPFPAVQVLSEAGEAKIFSAGIKHDGSPMAFEEGIYPDSAFPATLVAPVFPFSCVGLSDRGTELYDIALATLRELIDSNVYKAGAYGCSGHTPVPQAAARLGMRDDVLKVLSLFVRRYQHFPNGFMHYSSLDDGHFSSTGTFNPRFLSGEETSTNYRELHEKSYGERRPVASRRFLHMYYETGSNIVAGMHDMLLQCHEGVVRVFPAYPRDRAAAFRLRAYDALEIASELRDGQVVFIRIRAQKTVRVCIELPWEAAVEAHRQDQSGSRRVPVKAVAALSPMHPSHADFDMEAGESLVLYPAGRHPEMAYDEALPGTELANELPKFFDKVRLGKPRDF